MRDEPQYFVWDPPQGTHVAVIPPEEGVAGIRWFAGPLVIQTHSLDAWNQGDTLVADHFVADIGWFSQLPRTTEGLQPEKPRSPSAGPSTCVRGRSTGATPRRRSPPSSCSTLRATCRGWTRAPSWNRPGTRGSAA
jgi:hypothetical protein